MKKQATWIHATYLAIAMGGCGTIAGNPGSTKPPVAPEEITLPDASSINLTGLGTGSSTNLVASSCSEDANLGVFGFAFGPVCSGAPLIDAFLYGSQKDLDGDEVITCADYNPDAEDGGILFTLLCSEAFIQLDNLKSLAGDDFAIDFSDFDSSDAIDARGVWTATAEDEVKYPANVRIWSPESDATLTGSLAMEIASVTTGRLYLNLFPFGQDLSADLTYGVPSGDATSCSAEPNKANCYWQDMSFKGPEIYAAGSVAPGMRVLVFADDKDNPTFYRIEAKIRYTDSYAAVVFDPNNSETPQNFENVREIYLRAIQNGNEIWGSFDFKDSSDATISSPFGIFDLGNILRNGFSDDDYSGICQKLGSDDLVECENISYLDYESFWIGDASFTGIGSDYILPITFGEAPAAGVVFGP